MRFNDVYVLTHAGIPGYVSVHEARMICTQIARQALLEGASDASDSTTKAQQWSSYLHRLMDMIDDLSERGLVAVSRLSGLIKKELVPTAHIQDLVRKIQKIGDDAQTIGSGPLKVLTKTATETPGALEHPGETPTKIMPAKYSLASLPPAGWNQNGKSDMEKFPKNEAVIAGSELEYVPSTGHIDPDDRIMAPAVLVYASRKVYTGVNHGEALKAAEKAGEEMRDEDGRIDPDLAHVDLFVTRKGKVVDRYGSLAHFGVASSEELERKKSK